MDDSLRQKHNATNKLCQRKRLLKEEERERHRARERNSQYVRLMDPDKRKLHRERDKKTHAARLMDPEKRDIHRKREIMSQAVRLMDPEKRKIHLEREKKSQSVRLMDPEKRKIHQEREKKSQAVRLMDAEKRDTHRKRQKLSQAVRLMDQENRALHRERDKKSHSAKLMDPEKRDIHRKRERLSQAVRLMDQKKRILHRNRQNISQKKRLLDPTKRKAHSLINQTCQKKRLRNISYKIIHRRKMRHLQQKKMKNNQFRKEVFRKSVLTYYQRVAIRASKARAKIFLRYNKLIRNGPCRECVSCCRLLFKGSCKLCTIEMFKNKKVPLTLVKKCCVKMFSEEIVGYLCSTCQRSLNQSKIPKFSLCKKGLQFPVVPEQIKKLTPLEERFLCPRIPFMQIRSFGGHQQYTVKGRIVNVPTDVAENIDVLPRLPHQTDVIPVVLKKNKSFKSNVMFQTVRPKVIIDALKSLESSAVFREANIRIDYNRIHELKKIQSENKCIDHDEVTSLDSDDTDGDIEPVNVPAEETLLQSEAIVFAPGENFQPIPLFMDTHVESLSFIKIYGGEIKEYPKDMSYQDITKSEVMRSDRRVASSVDKLFFSSTFLRAQKISNSISICLKKSKGKTTETVGNVLSNDFLNSLIIHDSGYKVFAPDRGSPAYLEQKKREVFAMLRQLGPPTFFLTFSPAETKWPELLVILKKVVDGVEMSENEAQNLEYQEKVRLIKQDPVTCAVYFDYRLRQLFNVLRAKGSIFREFELVDSYTRIEFQNRGSPHGHSIIWLKGAPHLEEGNAEKTKDCEIFVDKFVTCQAESAQVPSELIHFQSHKHTFTCWKKNRTEKKCRFGIPMFPMYETKILEPLEESVPDSKIKHHKDNFLKVRKLLDLMYKNEEIITIEDFLNRLSLTHDEYIMALRSSLKHSKCFLKRSLKDIKINAYNPEILLLHRSNMDIQFITDVYSCAMYVLNYINKSNSCVSKVLREAMKEINKGDVSIKEKLRFLANKFLNASEFTAQEAVYYILSLPLSICSRSCVFINTGPPEKRVRMLKSKRDLLMLPVTSTEIFKKGIIDHYSNRPNELEGICLAEFAALYTCTYTKSSALHHHGTPDDNDESYKLEGNKNELPINHEFSKIKKAKIIRYVRYRIEQDESNYYREQLMLFLPWKNEQKDLIDVDHKRKFMEFKDEILINRSRFIYNDTEDNVPLDPIDQAINDKSINEESDDGNNEDETNEYDVLHDRVGDADILVDVGIDVNKKTMDDIVFPVPNMINDDEFNKLVRSLNKKQKMYLIHILNCIKLNKTPIYECILGGAGVGKSRLIEAIQQTLIRYFNTKENTDLESTKVLICAPTGKAAYNVKGMTLHSAFILPLNQLGFNMPPLSSSVSNTLLSKLKDLKLIIMDEVSMIGSKLFGQINMRLQQIFRSEKPFAAVSIVMFGDFNQLAPVGDRYIFKPDPSNLYGDLVGNPLWNKFSFYQLTEIMRQKDDKTFALALNHLAQGILSQEEVQMFKSRQNLKEPQDVLRLFRSNAEVDNYNESVLMKRTDAIVVNATDKIVGKVPERVKISLLKSVKELKVTSTYGLPKSVKISIGVHYMITNNISVTDGLVNGAVGILKFVEKNLSGEVKRLWLKFDDALVGKEVRESLRSHIISKGIDSTLTPIGYVTRNIKPRKNTVAVLMRKQFPLVPAEAITIYKSQGGTYTAAVVNLKPGMRRNELYVACSRVTSLTGLYIKGNFIPPKPSIDEVSKIIKDVQEKKPIHMTLSFLEDSIFGLTVVFHNIQSLRKHHADLNSDPFQTSATVIALVETWTTSDDDVSIAGYTEVYRANVQRSERHAYGLIVYCKSYLAYSSEVLFEFNCEEKHKSSNMVVLKVQNVAICVAYKPPSTAFLKVKCQIEAMIDSTKNVDNVIVLGDFNLDLLGKSSNSLKHIFKLKGLMDSIGPQPSTNGITQLDVCFSNMTNLSASYFESYYSYHKPIICVIKEIKKSDSFTPEKQDKAGNYKNSNAMMEKFRLEEICSSNLKNTLNFPVPLNRKIPPTDVLASIDQSATAKLNAKDEVKISRTDIHPVGFENNDHISCYANAVCQCTFYIQPLREAFISDISHDILKLLNDYCSCSIEPLSTKIVREFVDNVQGNEIFTRVEQQDAAEFITSLYSCIPALQEVSKYNLIYEYKCQTCLFSTKNVQKGDILLPVYLIEQVNSLQSLYENTYGKWKSVDGCCIECGSINSLQTQTKVELEDSSSVITVQLVLFDENGQKQPVVLKKLHEERIVIGGVSFVVKGLILHHGDTVHEGHYTCKLRTSYNSWIIANDRKVEECANPSFEYDVYIVILEKRKNK